jgi:hypothetical protein
MGRDYSEISPAPWGCVKVEYDVLGQTIQGYEVGNAVASSAAFCRRDDEAAFIALSRNVFDIMMRRKWEMSYGEYFSDAGEFENQFAVTIWIGDRQQMFCAPDPLRAWEKADKWYRENVEAQP